jgi:nucleotide-binding universal stress UspA family protein
MTKGLFIFEHAGYSVPALNRIINEVRKDVLNMTKLKILVPLDGSERSMHSVDWLKRFFGSDKASVTLLNVIEITTLSMLDEYYMPGTAPQEGLPYGTFSKRSNLILDEAGKLLDGYEVEKISNSGLSADIILSTARDGGFDMVVMTKSSTKGLARFMGSVTTKVVRDSEVAVVVVPE